MSHWRELMFTGRNSHLWKKEKKIRVNPRDTWRKCRHLIEAGGENPGIVVPMGQWHKLECLESGTVFMVCKDGVYEPLAKDEMLNL